MIYSYEATNRLNRKTESGYIEAKTREEAERLLFKDNLIVSKLKPAGQKPFSGRKEKENILLFTRLLKSSLTVKLPLSRSLDMIANEFPEKSRMRQIIRSILKQVEKGKLLSDALGIHPHLFNGLYISMVQAGEKSAKLDISLDLLLKQLSMNFDLSRKVSLALMYPGLVFASALIVLSFFITVLIPKFRESYERFGGRLPDLTNLVVNFSVFIRNNWFWIIPATVTALVLLYRYFYKGRGRAFIEKLAFRLPFVGRFLIRSEIAAFARILSVQINNGIRLKEALITASGTLNSVLLKTTIMESVKAIKKGIRFTEILKSNPMIPSFFIQSAAMGEESGDLGGLLESAADFYDKETAAGIEKITTLITPALILCVGLIIGLIVFALFLPIMNISEMIK